MSKRKDWVVTFPAGVLAQAATAKLDHHEARLEYWQERAVKAEAELKEHGIEIDEASKSATSNYLQPRFDSALWKQYQDCAGKVSEHREKVQEYGAWMRALSLASERDQQFALDVDDVSYFGL
jgi:hypothetical protein